MYSAETPINATAGVPSARRSPSRRAGRKWELRTLAATGTRFQECALSCVVLCLSLVAPASAQPTRIDFDTVTSSTVTSTPPGSAALTIQNFPQYSWSNNRQLFWQATAPGQTLTLNFTPPAAGSYQLRLNLTKSYDYGIVSFALNGTGLPGTVFDGYSSTVLPQQWADLGLQTLNSGVNTLVLTVTGKNAAQTYANKLYAGIDFIDLVPECRAAVSS